MKEHACKGHWQSKEAKAVVKIVFGLAIGLSCELSFSQVHAAEPRWPSGTYKYITVDQAVGDALIEFGRNVGVPVRISTKVKGRLNGGMPIGTAREFLEWVCGRYGLVWHFDGSVLNVAAETEMQTEVIKLDANSASGAAERLATLGASDPRFPIKVSEKDDVISVAGPPSYVALIKKTLRVPSNTPRVPQDKAGVVAVRVFRGRSSESQNFPIAQPQ